jgi:excisionase family DNA binding protein
MLTPKQLAERLSLSLSMVYRMLGNGEIECYRFGTAYRVSEEQLTRFLSKQKVEQRGLPERKTRRHV